MKQNKIKLDIQHIVTQLGLPTYSSTSIETKKEPNAKTSDSISNQPLTKPVITADHLLN